MGSVPISTIDASHPGVYRIDNVCLHPGTPPTLEFFTDDGRVPASFAEDRATAVWIHSIARRRSEQAGTSPQKPPARYVTEGPVYLFLVQDNPAHSLHDVLFSVALLAFEDEAQIPCFSSFIDSAGASYESWGAQWARFVHRACGIVEPWGEILWDGAAPRPIFFRHLVVPKFMRHRFAHEWVSASGWRPREYIDQSSDYPQHVLEGLQRRLHSSCFGEPIRSWGALRDDSPYAKLLLHDRGGSYRRRWENGAQIFAWLEQYYGERFGSMQFVSADYEDLSVREQARLFHDAEIVIAPHGAALANLVFCRPGTHILELTDEPLDFGWYTFTRRLGMRHVPFRPVSLKKHDQASFGVGIEEIENLMRAVLSE